ncbi:MAG: Dabb family protein [Rhodoglobus sp.]|nr:Dabb family protein [Rhodoglobus sp.]
MIRHIVAWKLTAQSPEEKATAIAAIAAALEPLVGVVPGLHSLTVRSNAAFFDTNWDGALVSEHDSVEALEAYQVHPAHVAAAAVPRSLAAERVTVDVEL